MSRAKSSLVVLLLLAATPAAYLAATSGGAVRERSNSGNGNGNGHGHGRPSTRPVAPSAPAQPAAPQIVVARVRPMPPEHRVIQARSIFAGQPAKRGGDGEDRAAADAPPPEARWVLRGVAVQSGRFTALIEDSAGKRVHRLEAGDSVARGRLTGVGFDGLVYQTPDGAATRVSIGSTLAGQPAPPTVVASRKGDKGDKQEKHDKGEKNEKGEKGGENAERGQDKRRDREAQGPASASSS